MKSIAVVNQKGGIGKTTVATHLGYAGRDAGLRVLMFLPHLFASRRRSAWPARLGPFR
jgi:dethiobiotin synthetase